MISQLLARLRSLWRGLRHRADVEAEMAEEFRHHIALRTEDLISGGRAPEEAARQARLEFGHIESHKQNARASRGLRLFDTIGMSWLDVKLGLRMLRKYPGLSLISVIGMSVAIAIGAGAFGVIDSMLDPTLPLPQGDRVISIQNSNVRNPGNPNRQSLHDFVIWREELTSVKDLGAFMSDRRNLIIPGRGVELVRVAEMTASGFRVALTPPLLGRPLLDEDEREDSPPVVVIAYEEWQRRFAAYPDIIGRQVRLGSELHTVVGVMPEGFRFPINHRYWVPLKLDPDDYQRGGGPALFMFGRLADGVTLDDAQAELTTLGLRTAARYPETHAQLRPRALRYTRPFFDVDSPAIAWAFRAAQLAISVLLVVVAVNVSILVYARTATRAGEIAVRTALGASRRRIVVQLFAEALVLSGMAAAIGLTVAGVALTRIQEFLERASGSNGSGLPFWWDLDLSAGLVGYVAGLAILAAVIVGALPALKATGRRVQAGLQRLESRGSGMQLGRTWTALIVTQVAVTVAALPFAIYVAGETLRGAGTDAGYPAAEFVRARLAMEREEAPPAAHRAAYERAFEARFLDRAGELLRRLDADPAISGVAFASSFPGSEPYERMEVEGRGTHWVFINRVDVEFFSVLDVPIPVGRAFDSADGRDPAHGVIVNRAFAERLFGGVNVLGRRIRHVGRSTGAEPGDVEPGPWLEIVGVVPDFAGQLELRQDLLKVYEPAALADVAPVVSLLLHVRGTPAPALTQRVRQITAAVDPALQLHELRSAADAEREIRRIFAFVALVTAAVLLSVVLLSAAGIYAMMSFIVARRRREIAIRSALGADPRRLLTGIFARASAQLGAGVLVGLLLAAVLRGPVEGKGLLLLPAVAAVMMVVGLVAALGPARRGLAVQPAEALRED
ncbi:MAG: FtsX-like permease family protein [Gemmatimonadetes bacterium]|uniref:FtsX-like permease family protein n=1 Tax=Candidatus Kutchimonas denitrificans TaxID=3056748 RepID=A0AAE4Z9F6_9BACT|nr:FtsX-like permease family protein [Gemmatimonadota bacterium]NIR75724.1 FtsX-like permease family protein [Candidatus Kutchimonas denitrificans]NIS00337.1 FtsX-like permease family protein [Gemmatimonadota bacterium]NIT65996.1 FtsX-like permease family protein [Gemmatimonadota bacterium]NIU53700.1 FtsX-like permease family protein [Gemmatimonadota bacterium]